MDKRMYSNSSSNMSNPRQGMNQRGNMNNYMPINNRNNINNSGNNMGNYGGQGMKRMRNDDPRGDGGNAPHRMKWDSFDDDKNTNNNNNNMSFLERNDIDQRSEPFGQFTNITTNETAVLCLTVQNAKYPITLDVIRKICSITGQLLRICILRLRNIQVLVELDSIETARRIKNDLDGADIYSNCCTLKIDYANLKHLVVRGNDQDNLDLTVDDSRYGRRRTLLNSPPRGVDRFDSSIMNNQSFASNSRFPSGLDRFSRDSTAASNYPSQQQLFDSNTQGNFLGQQINSLDRQQQEFFPYQIESNRFRESSSPPLNSSMKIESFVFNVEGLSSPMWNCERLFNLLCLYGNVLCVKFLKSKEGGAMVQMNHCENLRQHMKSLNSTFIFGQTFVIVPSRQTEILPMNRPFPLENGEPSYMELSTNRNNRYLTSDQASKNHPVSPSHVLYYFNTPPNMSEIDVVRMFEDLGAKRPVKIKNFPPKKEVRYDRNRRGNNQPKGVTGLAEFRTITDACECLILANNCPISHKSSNWPFYFKVTFSATPITDEDAKLGEELDTTLATITIGNSTNGRRQQQQQQPHDRKSPDDDNSSEHRRHRHSSPTN